MIGISSLLVRRHCITDSLTVGCRTVKRTPRFLQNTHIQPCFQGVIAAHTRQNIYRSVLSGLQRPINSAFLRTVCRAPQSRHSSLSQNMLLRLIFVTSTRRCGTSARHCRQKANSSSSEPSVPFFIMGTHDRISLF